MNYEKLSPEQRQDVDRRILKGYGELVTYKWTELVEVQVVEAEEPESDEEAGAPVKLAKKRAQKAATSTILQPVPREDKYYIGKMTLQQTSGIISILAAVFANGASLKASDGRTDNLAFLQFLDEYHLSLLFSLVMAEKPEWVIENFDVTQGVEVIMTFFTYNNFFALLQKVEQIGKGMGVSSETVRKAILGSPLS